MKEASTIGVDLAKSVFQVHGADAAGHMVFQRRLRRCDVVSFFARHPACLVGMEACGTAHYWARQLGALGHRVKLIAPKAVKGYIGRGKSDAIDAEAICEAVTRPRLREVAVKTVEQQSTLMLHRARDLLIRQRTQTINSLRSHMAELGVIAAVGDAGAAALVVTVADAADPRLPPLARLALSSLTATLQSIRVQIGSLDAAIQAAHEADATSRRLASIPGIGPLTASAIVATVGDARVFKSGRAFAAWLGLTPRISGTGGKTTLGPITKQGDRYLRRLLMQGATSALTRIRRQPDRNRWATQLLDRLAFKPAAVALANKAARIVWVLMTRGGTYAPGHQPAPFAATA